MTTEEYLNQVIELLRLQVINKKVFTNEEIEGFKEIKPVPLGVQLIEILSKKYEQPDRVDIYDFEKSIAITSDYPHLKEVLEIIQGIYLEENRMVDVDRVSLTRSFIENNLEYFCEVYDYLEFICNEFLEKRIDTLEDIEKQLYIVEDVVALRILTNNIEKYAKFFAEPNMGFLAEELQDENSKFILIEGTSNAYLIDVVAFFLAKQGKEVFLIKSPISYESEGVQIKDTLAISIENIQKQNNITYVYPIKIISEINGEEDNIPFLLEYINNHYNKGGHINVLGQGYQIDEISVRPLVNKKMTRLSQYYYDKREYNLTLARYGDYLEYISKIYKEDCRELLYRKPTKKFSIVIPARDSIETLQYTIKTCLEQSYTGDYEVVISDNSVKNMAVYEFCKELNNSKITYIKTPRNLSLTKSFEFAYLHTSGEFVFSIGSDDGVLPWALEVLDGIRSKFPNENIINWVRGFYAWPGFNYGQQNQFIIPNNSKVESFASYYIKREEYFKRILADPQMMYVLPLLYINSGFKREYMQVMYQKTGELFDGHSQDIYTGIEMMALNDKVLNISLALTIAGMSSNSVGATNDDVKSLEIKAQRKKALVEMGNVGLNVQTLNEHFVTVLASDVSTLYIGLMRAVSKGLLQFQTLEKYIDWKDVFIKISNVMRVENITYYEDLFKLREAASLFGEEFLNWFDQEVLNKKLKLCILDEEKIKQYRKSKTYKNGIDQSGQVIWDASEFGVKNVYQAVKIFEKIVSTRNSIEVDIEKYLKSE